MLPLLRVYLEETELKSVLFKMNFKKKIAQVGITKITIISFLVISFLVTLVSAGLFEDSLDDKVKDREYIDELRSTDLTILDDSFWTFNARNFSYYADDRRVVVSDKDNMLINFSMLTPYENKVYESNETMIVEFYLYEFHKDAKDWIKGIRSFNVKTDYGEISKTFISKYAVDYDVEECYELEENKTFCRNITKTNWIKFKDLKELPSNTNQRVGLFTDVVFGEKIEWIPEIFGFEVLQFAEFEVTFGSKFEFDTVAGSFNSLVQINDSYYLNVYTGSGTDGYAVVLKVDGETITKPGSALEFETVQATEKSVVKINDTHYLVTYYGSSFVGYTVVLVVDGTTVTKPGTRLSTGSSTQIYNSLAKINDTHYLNTYSGSGSDGFAVVLVVDGTTVTKPGAILEFDTSQFGHSSLVKINDTHYIVSYSGLGSDGYAVVLVVDGLTITKPGSALRFEADFGQYNSLVKISDTHYLNTYTKNGVDGFAVVLVVDGTTITKPGATFEFDAIQGTYNSLVKINDTHYLNTYAGSGGYGYAVVLKVDGTTITKPSSSFQFDSLSGSHNSLVKINDTHYLNTYAGSGGGYSVVVKVWEDGYSDGISPTYSNPANNNSIGNQETLFSIKWDDTFHLAPNGQYIFSTNNTGSWVNDSTVNFTSTPYWANVTKTLNSTVGMGVGYRWYATDNKGNANNTEIFTLTVTHEVDSPVVTLNEPSSGIVYAEVQNVAFNCTPVDDSNVENSTFFWSVDGWGENGTDSSASSGSKSTFIRNVAQTGEFEWNCYACDLYNNCAFSESNFTFSYHTYELTITNPTTSSPQSVSTDDNVSVSFNVLKDGANVTSGIDLGSVLIGGEVAQINQVQVETWYIRTGDDGVTDINGVATTSFANMPDTDYSALGQALTDDDVVYSVKVVSKAIGGIDWWIEDDGGSNEIANFMYASIEHGHLESNSNHIECGSELGSASSFGITFDTEFPSTNYSAICNPLTDSDSPICIQDDIVGKAISGLTFQINDDGGSTEYVGGIDWCVFQHGEYDMGEVTMKSNSQIVVDGAMSVSFDTNFSDNSYTVFITDGTSYTADGCECEVDARNVDGFTATCADDYSSTSVCDEIFDWVAIEKGDFNSTIIGDDFGYIAGLGWQVNVTAPAFESGLKDLFVNVTVENFVRNDTESNAINYEASDTCTCAGLGTDWEINLADHCNITSNCNISTGNITFINNGSVLFNATLTANKITWKDSVGVVEKYNLGSIFRGWIG